jgi:hypothetical protein
LARRAYVLQPFSTVPQSTPPTINVIDHATDCEAGPIEGKIPFVEMPKDEENEEDEEDED